MEALDYIDDDTAPDLYDTPKEELFKIYEHKETMYRIAFPYDIDTPEARSLRRLKRRLKHAAITVNYNRFITFSYDDEHLPARSSHISKTMHRMRDYYRKCGTGKDKLFPYFYRLEFGGKHGRPHFHALVKAPYIPEDRMAKWWPHGFHKIRKVDSPIAAIGYIGKYMSKPDNNFANHDTTHLKRRWGCAAKLTPPSPKPDYKFVVYCSKQFLQEWYFDHNAALDKQLVAELSKMQTKENLSLLIESRTTNGKVFILPKH